MAAITEARVEGQLSLPQIKPRSGPLRRLRYPLLSRPRLPLPPPPLRSRFCCRQDLGPSAAITTKVKPAATVKNKTPAAINKVVTPDAADIKVEKTEQEEVVATVVTGEEGEVTKMSPSSSPQRFDKFPSLHAPKFLLLPLKSRSLLLRKP